ncbi:M1 family metallopeptidase [Brevundimonas sp. SL130]|uniref:M1 family metallopeptidase n=1 Tax=Brevundimonas sp. SL130 TaxID=2995143 RepID=UPI00226C932E|nr:M1 family metallopeptidase [Brevundimonas sp. SL130]WAC59058.1 M1 family metallopeptidase [Brevundimonas sp. SL130]
MKFALFGLAAALLASGAQAQVSVGAVDQSKGGFEDKFRQFEGEDWPTPSDYRNASGAPGYRYWQQQVDYDIDVALDEANRTLNATQVVTYRNNAPDSLGYLWLLLDQQNYRRDSMAERSRTYTNSDTVSVNEVLRVQRFQEWEGGFNDLTVVGPDGQPLPFTIVDSMMRVELPRPLATGESFTFRMGYSLPLPETKVVGGRSGYECFTEPGEDGNCLFLAAQWFPRLAVYSDYEGWHNQAFLGAGEFTLEFGDYQVSITAPADHIVASTGVLTNPEILSAEQRARLERARIADAPVYIVTPAEALAAEGRPARSGVRTWNFRADNVRDFAFASSRKFIWDAMGIEQDSAEHPVVMAMSFYPKEGRPLWDAYSTRAIAHTIDVYNQFAFTYPYPTAQSVNGPVGGMEYPMITFNGPRPVKDDKGRLTYTERAKNGLIGVVIHEVGHIYFPMTVNSDERQWSWMDEGLNSFLQFQAEKLWDADFPSRGEPKDIVEYMVSQDQMPVMTQSDAINQFGPNAYAKPATALVILRETVLGRELFDRAFREYAQRWRFKRPTPYDFFRSMEEGSGVDLDWFWRGWFYSTDHVDVALEGVTAAKLESTDPEVRNAAARTRFESQPGSLTAQRNAGIETVVERDPATRDFYNETDRFTTTAQQRRDATSAAGKAKPERRRAQTFEDNIYRFTFKNIGGLVSPVIVKLTWSDGTDETIRIPAEIWRRNPNQVVWQYVSSKTLAGAEIDPLWETADANRGNNSYPQRIDERSLSLSPESPPGENRMRDSDVEVSPDSTAARVVSGS